MGALVSSNGRNAEDGLHGGRKAVGKGTSPVKPEAVPDYEDKKLKSSTAGFRSLDDPCRIVYGENYDPSERYETTPEEKVTDEAKLRMLAKIVENDSCLLKHIDEERRIAALKRMEPQHFKTGDVVCKQDVEKDFFYLVESGEFTAFERPTNSEGADLGNQCEEFNKGNPAIDNGALLFREPRPFTVKCTKDGTLWKIHRRTYAIVLLNMAYEKRTYREGLLDKVDLLDVINPIEKARLPDVMEPKKFKKGETIYCAGQRADGIYWVVNGEVKLTNGGTEVKGNRDYFGELALISKAARRNTATAEADSELLFLGTEDLERKMGTLKTLWGGEEKFKELCRERFKIPATYLDDLR